MKYKGITHDSRKVKPGYIYVAIPGAKFNGTDFIPQAVEAGAKLIVAEKDVQVPAGIEFKKVSSARKALAELACEVYDYPSKKLKLIGITGTNGKTTTAYLIQSILKKAGHKTEVIGTINSSLTTPEASDLQPMLAEMVKRGVTHCVMEVSSHALSQLRVAGCEFAVAIFTNLTHDHLDFHQNMEQYLAAKLELFKMLPNDGIAIINADDPYTNKVMAVVPGEVVTYGIGQAKHELRNTKHNDFDTNIVSIKVMAKEMLLRINSLDIRTNLIGLPNVYNIVAAYQCALVLGVPQRVIKQGIEALKTVPGRVEPVDCGQPFRVIVDFAHSPDALQKLIETFRPLTEGKVILVFGCPGDRDKAKRPVMGEIAGRLADLVIVTTDDPHGEEPQAIIDDIIRSKSKAQSSKEIPSSKLKVQIDRKKAIEQALSMAKKGDTVLIAGRGHEQFQDFNGKKVSLDDREVVEKYLSH